MIKECEEALQDFKGNIVEIGVGYGENTIKFLDLAEKYNRKVICIDPFEDGWKEMPSTYRYAFEIFNDKTISYKEYLILHKKNSLCMTSEILCKGEIAFAYVDGLQYKGAVLNDLRIVSHAHVICVDDMDRETPESQVPSAVHEYIKQTGKQLIIKDRWAFIR